MAEDRNIPRIGRSIPRQDAYSKVTGREKYAADYYGERLCWAGVKRAGVPHAVLKAIHTEHAKGIPGVVAVLTHEDVSGSNRQGLIKQDSPLLVNDKIRHCGDAVALVVTESKEAMMQALNLVTFDYELLPGVFDPEEALKEGAPRVHEKNPDGNLVREVSIGTEDAPSAMNDCHFIVEGTFETPSQEHAYLETEAGLAYMEEGGKLIVIASTQTPHRDRMEIAHALGIGVEKVEVVAPYLGGGFGGKDGITVQSLLGLAALHTGGRPVKMWWDREESFLAGVKRIRTRMHYRLGAKSDGMFHALQCWLYFDAGAYAGLTGEIMTLAIEHAAGAYRIPHANVTGKCAYTNNPIGGPFRGFGVPQVTAAIEQMVDMLAEKMHADPLELRMKNALVQGDKNAVGITLTHSTGVKECLETLSRHQLWLEREAWKASAPAFKLRGIGVACLSHAMGYPPIVPDTANAKIELTPEGIIRVYSGVVDMGQGNASTCLQIAGDILNQEMTGMELVLPDTRKTLPSGSASASRCTYTYGNALIEAAKELKGRILEKTARLLRTEDIGRLVLIPGAVQFVSTGREVPLFRVAGLFDDSERVCVSTYTMPAAKEGLDLVYMGPHTIFSYGAHLAYVEVDKLTGAVEVTAYLAVTDAGKVLNPDVYEQQIQGSIAQSIGYALMEDFIVADGRIQTADLSTYIIPTALDVSDMVSVPVEIGEETGPYGLKGVGEIGVSGPVPAIANAIADACGVRTFRAPFTGESVLKALF